MMKYSMLTGVQAVPPKPEVSKDDEELQALLSILSDELSTHSAEPEMDGRYLAKPFMLKLNKVSHKFQLLAQ